MSEGTKNHAKKPTIDRNKQLCEALRKKKECNARAQAIVEFLLDTVENADIFLKKLPFINQCHYEDVVQERAILKLCGYPLCKGELIDIPEKQFHISTVTNKVYDITERKNFCSIKCFKSSQYIKEQLLTGPLWLRDQEAIPEFKLFDTESYRDKIF